MSTDATVDPTSTQLYINNLNFATTTEQLTQFFEDKIKPAKATEVNIVTRRGRVEGRSRGFGFVRVPNEKVTVALTLNGTTLGEREVGVVVANPKTERPPREAKAPREKKVKAPKPASTGEKTKKPRARKPLPERKVHDNATQLYVNNLHFDVTTEELSAFFEGKSGAKPVEVDIVTSKFGRFKGRSRGFGFVTVPNSAVTAAVATAGQTLHERELGVVVARERTAAEIAAANEAKPAATADAASAGQPKEKKPRASRAKTDATAAAVAPAKVETKAAAPAAKDGQPKKPKAKKPKADRPAA